MEYLTQEYFDSFFLVATFLVTAAYSIKYCRDRKRDEQSQVQIKIATSIGNGNSILRENYPGFFAGVDSAPSTNNQLPSDVKEFIPWWTSENSRGRGYDLLEFQILNQGKVPVTITSSWWQLGEQKIVYSIRRGYNEKPIYLAHNEIKKFTVSICDIVKALYLDHRHLKPKLPCSKLEDLQKLRLVICTADGKTFSSEPFPQQDLTVIINIFNFIRPQVAGSYSPITPVPLDSSGTSKT